MSATSPQPIQRYTKMMRSDLSGYWFDAYGWIACYFAQLEGLSYALIEGLGSAEDKARLARLPYQVRTEKAKTLVCDYLSGRGDDALADEWASFLNEARNVAPMRNKILHNPLTVNLALGDPLHDPEAGIRLVHESGKPVMQLGEVQAFSKAMLDLNLRMQALLTRSGLAAALSPP